MPLWMAVILGFGVVLVVYGVVPISLPAAIGVGLVATVLAWWLS